MPVGMSGGTRVFIFLGGRPPIVDEGVGYPPVGLGGAEGGFTKWREVGSPLGYLQQPG